MPNQITATTTGPSRLTRLLAQAAIALTLLTGAVGLPGMAQAQGYGAIAFSPNDNQWDWST